MKDYRGRIFEGKAPLRNLKPLNTQHIGETDYTYYTDSTVFLLQTSA